jgi:hypothetical protein
MDGGTSPNDHEVVSVVENPFAPVGLYHQPKEHIMELRSNITGNCHLIGLAVLKTMLSRAAGAAEVQLVKLQDELAKTLVQREQETREALPSRCRCSRMPFW